MTTVWVIRTLPGAEATAKRVQAAGFEPFIAPLLEVVFQPGDEIDLTGVTALAFTSANGVRAFAARSTERDLATFAVGRGTAKAARESGFARVTASDGDVLALAQVISPGGLVLHAGAAEPAADLVLALQRGGVAARGIVVYRTVPAGLSQSEIQVAAECDYVLLQSAKAARAFLDLNLTRPRPVSLSPAIAADLPGRGWVSAQPNEDALIVALIEAAR